MRLVAAVIHAAIHAVGAVTQGAAILTKTACLARKVVAHALEGGGATGENSMVTIRAAII